MKRHTPKVLTDADVAAKQGLACLPTSYLENALAAIEAALWGVNAPAMTKAHRARLEAHHALIEGALVMTRHADMMRAFEAGA